MLCSTFFEKLTLQLRGFFSAILQAKLPQHEIHHNNQLKIKLHGLQNAANVVQLSTLFNLKRFSLHYLTEYHQEEYYKFKILICTEERNYRRTEVEYVTEEGSSELVFNGHALL